MQPLKGWVQQAIEETFLPCYLSTIHLDIQVQSTTGFSAGNIPVESKYAPCSDICS